MMRLRRCPWLLGLAALALLAVPVRGELEVSLEISGDLDEIMAVLRALQGAGLGGLDIDPNDPLKLRVHSVHTPVPEEAIEPAVPDAPKEEEAPPLPPPLPPPLRQLTVTPASVQPGAPLLVTVTVADGQTHIDTIAVSFDCAAITADLYDNGASGDATPGDGIWSARILVPEKTMPGECEVRLTAYDVNGAPVLIESPEGAAPLEVAAGIEVALP